MKFARRWLYSKGVMVQEEAQSGGHGTDELLQELPRRQRPRADLEVGMADSIAVMLSNKAMDEGRKVYFNEIDKLGTDAGKANAA